MKHQWVYVVAALGLLLSLLVVGIAHMTPPKVEDIPWNVREGHS